jgi:O-acetyl-ADP-ribose deacetylase (regulator of RNase III)
LEVAAQAGIRTLAFPCISTGIYGYPAELAARVAVDAVQSSLKELPSFQEVIFCCFSTEDQSIYARLLDQASA